MNWIISECICCLIVLFGVFSDVTELQLNLTDDDSSTSSSVQWCRRHDLLSAHAVNIRLSGLSAHSSLAEKQHWVYLCGWKRTLGCTLLGLLGIFLSNLKAVYQPPNPIAVHSLCVSPPGIRMRKWLSHCGTQIEAMQQAADTFCLPSWLLAQLLTH